MTRSSTGLISIKLISPVAQKTDQKKSEGFQTLTLFKKQLCFNTHYLTKILGEQEAPPLIAFAAWHLRWVKN